ncbi:MAG TPA: hypothetical protein PLP73_02010 [Candidatus Absconditabacterales bacterium]|nr:hypothetical protein [Candidatus Absconditabacterales bacterium]
MEEAFSPSMSYDTVINIGRNKKQVGDTVLREKTLIEAGDSPFQKACFLNGILQEGVDENGCLEIGGERRKELIDIQSQAPLIVRIAKFLLRMTVVLSISMVIFNAIKYMIEVLGGKDRKSAESKKNLIYVAVGVIVALLSVSVINLIISVPKSSLQTSDDISGFTIGCQIGTSNDIISGDNLKKYLCENILEGERKPKGLVGKQCYILTGASANTRQKIKNEDAKAMCVNNLGGIVVN